MRALEGIKVLDLTMNLPGPYMTWLLTTMGAEVVKIENPEGGDYARALGGQAAGESSPFFEAVNRNKKSVTLNLKHTEGLNLFLKLLDTYDIVVEGFRPGTMDKLGLSYETMRERQPRLIQVSISGYGQAGPYRLRAGHDVNYLALAGVLGMTGTRDGELAIPGIQIADLAGGSLMALSGLLAAVILRERTGEGQWVDVSMFHGSLSLATMVFAGVEAGMEKPEPAKMILTGRCACYGLYKTKDGRYMSLGALEFKFWANFCAAVGRPDLVAGQFGGRDIISQVAAIFAERTQDEWAALFKDHDACCEPVLSLTEAVVSDLVTARRMMENAQEGRRFLASPLAGKSPAGPEAKPAPQLGEHTLQTLGELGLNEAELASLAASGII